MILKINKLYEKINDKNNVIIFGLSYCSYCKKTIELLKKKKISYKYYEIDKYYNIFFNLLNKIAEHYISLDININHRTFPVIFINKKFIGGYNELLQIFNN